MPGGGRCAEACPARKWRWRGKLKKGGRWSNKQEVDGDEDAIGL